MVWDFFDPAGSAAEFILKSRIHMYGKYVRCEKFVSRPPFSQCDRCLQHGHMTSSCKRPSSFVICYKCGGPHSATVHKHECIYANFKHKGLACNCPPSCFLCRVKGKKGSDLGHYATAPDCPLRKQFRSASPPHPVQHTPIPSEAQEPMRLLTELADDVALAHRMETDEPSRPASPNADRKSVV